MGNTYNYYIPTDTELGKMQFLPQNVEEILSIKLLFEDKSIYSPKVFKLKEAQNVLSLQDIIEHVIIASGKQSRPIKCFVNGEEISM